MRNTSSSQILVWGLMVWGIFLMSIEAYAGSGFDYHLKCNLGNEPAQSKTVGHFEISILPSGNRCELSISSIRARKTVFEYASTLIFVFADETDFNRDGHSDAVVLVSDASDNSYKLFIVSLGRHPGLIQSLENNYGFWLQDCQGDSQPRIWTSDGVFFDSPELREVYHYDVTVPKIALRLEGSKWVSAMLECRNSYDKTIKAALSKLGERERAAFRANRISDAYRKGIIKQRILAVVFCFLYSGRENQAREALWAMWPPDDRQRVWDWMQELRAKGLLAQAGLLGQ